MDGTWDQDWDDPKWSSDGSDDLWTVHYAPASPPGVSQDEEGYVTAICTLGIKCCVCACMRARVRMASIEQVDTHAICMYLYVHVHAREGGVEEIGKGEGNSKGEGKARAKGTARVKGTVRAGHDWEGGRGGG